MLESLIFQTKTRHKSSVFDIISMITVNEKNSNKLRCFKMETSLNEYLTLSCGMFVKFLIKHWSIFTNVFDGDENFVDEKKSFRSVEWFSSPQVVF